VVQRNPSDLLAYALEAVRVRDQALWTFLTAARGIAVVLDAVGCVVFASPQSLALTGRRPDEVLGREWVRTFQLLEDTGRAAAAARY
jgi:PAS domain-containing protein